ncbi:MAG: hypothetical protein J2P17_32880, partial [Mycobacterium sp.]|nr:hypothetical protein [Mycobacterium sp.]
MKQLLKVSGRHAGVAAIAVAMATVAACAPGGGGSSNNTATKAPSAISTNPAKAGKITLTV